MKKRLLITDDAMIIRTMIRDLATEAGWEVVAEATNGAEAVELYREFRPDAVTLDLVMPEFDGLHGLRGIREIDPDARVIVVSALNTQNVLKESFKLGATDFVLKPFQKQPLMETLEQAVATGN
jgi:two-component system chemotaxis response regulator CheY